MYLWDSLIYSSKSRINNPIFHSTYHSPRHYMWKNKNCELFYLFQDIFYMSSSRKYIDDMYIYCVVFFRCEKSVKRCYFYLTLALYSIIFACNLRILVFTWSLEEFFNISFPNKLGWSSCISLHKERSEGAWYFSEIWLGLNSLYHRSRF